MSVQAMRGLLQTQLLTVGTGWDAQTAYEGKPFTPTVGAAYQEVTTVFSEPLPITLSGSDEARGLFQVRLLYPVVTTGIGPQTARAEAIAAAFPRNLKLSSGGVTVKVSRKPQITRGPVQGDRDVTIVRIRFSDR
jgi:hypothetical protein